MRRGGFAGAALLLSVLLSISPVRAQEPIVFGVITPLSPPGETALGKNVIEQMLATAARTGIPVQAENDNVSALRRP